MIKSFTDLVGNSNTISIICQAIRRGTYPKFSILYGDYGTGKTSSAELIAKHINCSSSDPFNCSGCHNCDNKIGVKIINIPTINTNSNVEDLITDIFKLESIYDKTVFILEEFEMSFKHQAMLLHEFNKVHDNVWVILTTTKIKDIRQELKSRAISLRFTKLNKHDISLLYDRYTQSQGISYPMYIRDIIIQSSNGVPRDLINNINFINESKLDTKQIEGYLGVIGSGAILDLFMACNTSVDSGLRMLETILENTTEETLAHSVIDFYCSYLIKYRYGTKFKTDHVNSTLDSIIDESKNAKISKLIHDLELSHNINMKWFVINLSVILNETKRESIKVQEQKQVVKTITETKRPVETQKVNFNQKVDLMSI